MELISNRIITIRARAYYSAKNALNAVQHHLAQNTLDGITEMLSSSAGLDYALFKEHKDIQLAQKISEINTQIRDLLDNLPLGQIISPIILKLEQEKDQAIADENYLLAEEIKQQLNKEREIIRTPRRLDSVD